ncbi:MAG TPA: hypothetical protein V6D10_20165 [Trichocoleus sp.]|jgi:hypothetical protein
MLSQLPSYVEFDRIWSIKILECDRFGSELRRFWEGKSSLRTGAGLVEPQPS